MVTYQDVKNNLEVKELMKNAQKQLDVLGYTEHSLRHVSLVAERAGELLKALGYDEHRIELAKIAGYMHDIGNSVNRVDHAHSGAILAYNILKDLGMNISDRTEIMMAIGNHDERTGTAVSDISAALILADKSDAHRSRVSKTDKALFDKHDEVNYAVTNSELKIDLEERKVILNLTIDTKICPVIKYFEIFLERIVIPLSLSISFESITLVSTFSLALNVPDFSSSLSTKVVFPWST